MKADIVVVGGGHAGCEAALACARMGQRTVLVTREREAAARMSCNPAIGGLAKGQLVREIDALGGEMARIADRTGIQFRGVAASPLTLPSHASMLTGRDGPAHGVRDNGQTFGNEAHKRWRSLAAAESPSEMAREAHSLVSSCRSFGLAAVAEALADIEQQARQGRSASSDYLDELWSRLDDSLDALANWKPSG